jgi:hypothetical protein
LLHDVDPPSDAIEERRHEVETGLGDAHEASEMLDGVAVALVDDLDAHGDEQKHKDRHDGHEGGQHVSSPICVFQGMMRR